MGEMLNLNLSGRAFSGLGINDRVCGYHAGDASMNSGSWKFSESDRYAAERMASSVTNNPTSPAAVNNSA
jgi:hypothetical protein